MAVILEERNLSELEQGFTQQQIAAIANLVAGLLVYATLTGAKARLRDTENRGDWSYLRTFTRISTAIYLATAVFYLFFSWKDCRESPVRRSDFDLLLLANMLLVAASAIRFAVVFTSPETLSVIQAEPIQQI